MPDKLLKDGLRTSEKIGGVSEFAELLFVRLILATCHAGRCPWDPDWIRTHALPNRLRKRLTEIAAALETLRRAHLITRYTGHDGTAYLLIPNHGQRLRHAVRSPWPAPPEGPPDVEGQVFLALPGSPPPPAAPPTKRPCVRATHFTSLLSSSDPEGRRGEGAPAPAAACPAAADLRPAADCLDEIAPHWPRHDLRAQLRAARRYVRKERGEEADVALGWFVHHWLPRAPERAAAVPVAHAAPAAPAAPEPSDAERAAQLRALAASPEPAADTLEHALWLAAREALAETAA